MEMIIEPKTTRVELTERDQLNIIKALSYYYSNLQNEVFGEDDLFYRYIKEVQELINKIEGVVDL